MNETPLDHALSTAKSEQRTLDAERLKAIGAQMKQKKSPAAEQTDATDSGNVSSGNAKTGNHANHGECFQLKGSVATLTMLELYRYEHTPFSKQMSETTRQAPNFFKQTPVVLCLEKLTSPEQVDFIELTNLCQEFGLFPIAIRGGTQKQQLAALVAGLPKLPSSKPKVRNSAVSDQMHANAGSNTQSDIPTLSTGSNAPCKVIKQPVRSGQQVYAKGGDLIILGTVSAGAEVLADGHIHIYAPARGRVLAGVSGNVNARVFCRRLEPELISIAGHYKISDDISTDYWGKSVQVWLEDKQLEIALLN